MVGYEIRMKMNHEQAAKMKHSPLQKSKYRVVQDREELINLHR
jgi:hypothetical protein